MRAPTSRTNSSRLIATTIALFVCITACDGGRGAQPLSPDARAQTESQTAAQALETPSPATARIAHDEAVVARSASKVAYRHLEVTDVLPQIIGTVIDATGTPVAPDTLSWALSYSPLAEPEPSESLGNLAFSPADVDERGHFHFLLIGRAMPDMRRTLVLRVPFDGDRDPDGRHAGEARIELHDTPPRTIDIGTLRLVGVELVAAGTVVDADGMAIPGATITITSCGVDVLRPAARSDEFGHFELRALCPDENYTVKVSKDQVDFFAQVRRGAFDVRIMPELPKQGAEKPVYSMIRRGARTKQPMIPGN